MPANKKNKYGDSPYSRLERVKIHQRIATLEWRRVANKLIICIDDPLEKRNFLINFYRNCRDIKLKLVYIMRKRADRIL